MTSQSQIDDLIVALQHMNTATYLDVSAFAILVYDYTLTFHRERTLIWTSPWSVAKVLFILTRYLPFYDTVVGLWHQYKPMATNADCEFAYKTTGWTITLGILMAEIILVLRAWAIWERKRWVAISLTIWTFAVWIPDFVCLTKFLNALEFTPMPSPHLPGCLVTGGSSILAVNWIMLMVYEAGVLVLLAVKAVQKFRTLGHSIIYRTIYRDGSLFYLYIFALSVANVVVIQTLPSDFLAALASMERVIHSVLTARMLMNLRSVAQRRVGGTSWETTNATNTLELDPLRFKHKETLTGF